MKPNFELGVHYTPDSKSTTIRLVDLTSARGEPRSFV